MIQTCERSWPVSRRPSRNAPMLSRRDFDELTRPLIRHLVGHARSILQSDDLAWDAVQEALMGLWLKLDRGEPVVDYAGPWLCRAVVLRSLQIRRQMGRRTRHERQAAACRPECHEHHVRQTILKTGELKTFLEAAMNTLPEEYRIVLELRVRDGLDYAETAKRLGIPLGTVRSRLNRGRSLLQRVLQSAICSGALDAPESSVSVPPRLLRPLDR